MLTGLFRETTRQAERCFLSVTKKSIQRLMECIGFLEMGLEMRTHTLQNPPVLYANALAHTLSSDVYLNCQRFQYMSCRFITYRMNPIYLTKSGTILGEYFRYLHLSELYISCHRLHLLGQQRNQSLQVQVLGPLEIIMEDLRVKIKNTFWFSYYTFSLPRSCNKDGVLVRGFKSSPHIQ